MSARPPDELAAAAAAVLDVYATRPGIPHDGDHRRDPAYAGELVAQLLGDLMHYADAFGVDFDRELATARGFAAQERGESLLQVGDTAQAGRRRGVIIGAEFEPIGAVYDVWFLGEPHARPLPAEQVRPAPFPPAQLGHGETIRDLPTAMERLVELEARRRAPSPTGQPATLDDERRRRHLIGHLANWGGTTPNALLDSLAVRVTSRIREDSGQAADLAMLDFPAGPPIKATTTGHDLGRRTGVPSKRPSQRPGRGQR